MEIAVGPGEADLDAFDPTGGSARLAETDRHVRGNYTVIAGWAAREPAAGAAAAVGPVLAAAGGDPRHGPGHRAARGADPAGRRRAVHRDRGDAGHPGADGAAQRGLPERAAARRAVRRAVRRRAERGGPGDRPGRQAAARRVRGRLAEARPDRGDRHEQVRRRADRPGAAGRPGRRPGPGRRAAAPGGPAPAARGRPGRRGRAEPVRRAAGQPGPGDGQLRGLAADRDRRAGAGRRARPRRPGQAGQPGRPAPGLRRS